MYWSKDQYYGDGLCGCVSVGLSGAIGLHMLLERRARVQLQDEYEFR